jgi:hypothetical protein
MGSDLRAAAQGVVHGEDELVDADAVVAVA